jgi:hypothetical protein
VGLERGPLSLVSTIEELLERKSRGSGLESREYGRKYTSRLPRGILYPQKLALTPSTSGGRSVGVVRSRTQVTEFMESTGNAASRSSIAACIFVAAGLASPSRYLVPFGRHTQIYRQLGHLISLLLFFSK